MELSAVPAIFILVALEGIVLAVAIRFYKYRHIAVIRERFPFSSLTFAFLVAAHSAFFVLVRLTYGTPREGDCFWEDLASIMFTVGKSSAINIRSYFLWFKHNTQLQRSKSAETEHLQRAEDSRLGSTSRSTKHFSRSNFFLKHQNFLTWPYLLAITMWLFFWSGIPRIVNTAQCERLRSLESVGAAIGILTALLFLSLIFTAKDAFRIKFELGILFGCVLVLALSKALPKKMVGIFFIKDIVFLLTTLLMLFMLIGYPQLLAKKDKELEEQLRYDPVQMEQLEKFLKRKYGRDVFRDYLQTMFAVENLYFWEAVEYFREQPTLFRALRIYKVYIRPNADFQVNISHTKKSGIERNLLMLCPLDENCTLHDLANSPALRRHFQHKRWDSLNMGEKDTLTDLFDGAQGEVFRLMDGDSYIRFGSSQLCHEYMKSQITHV